jgi:hypothetical protein
MAKACTRLTQGNDTGGGTTSTTASISPAANSAIIVVVTTYDGGNGNTACSISGLGLSWTTKVNGVNYEGGGSGRVWVFAAYGSPSAGALTFTVTEDSFVNWVVDNITGTVATTPTNTNVDDNGGTGLTASGTLAAFADVLNGAWYFCITHDGVSHEPGTGWTEVSQHDGIFDFVNSTGFRDSNDTTPDVTLGGSSLWGFVALEIADSAAGAGSSVTKTPTTGNLSLGGLAPSHNAFNHVRIRDVLINESGQPIANAANITLKVWYSGYIAGPADFSRNAQTTDANGTASWSITRGSLVSGQTILYVAQDSLSFSNYTMARMVPSYEI